MNESLSGTTNMKMCDVCKKTQKKIIGNILKPKDITTI